MDDVSPSLPRHLLQENSVRSNFAKGGGSANVKRTLQDKRAFENFEADRRIYSSVSNSTKPVLLDSDVVSHSSPRRPLQNSKTISEFTLGTKLVSVIHEFHDKSAFEKFEASNRETSTNPMKREHGFHDSKVISRFPPRHELNNLRVVPTSDDFPLQGSTDMHFSEHPENKSRKKATANSIFPSARADLLPEVSPSPSSCNVGNLPDGGPCAGVPFVEPLGEVTFSVAPAPPLSPPLSGVPVNTTPARRPLISASSARRLLLSAPATSARRRLQDLSAHEGNTNAFSRDHQLETVPGSALIHLQDTSLFHMLDFANLSAPAAPAMKLSRPRKQPAPQQKVSSLLVEPYVALTTNFSVQTPASSSAEILYGLSSQEQRPAFKSYVPLLAEPLQVQTRSRRAPPRATQRRPTASAAQLAEDGRRRARPAD